MEWTDRGIVLSAQSYGETAAVVTLLTQHHGRYAGLVPGGQSSRRRADFALGSEGTASWRARLSEHLGVYTFEPSFHHVSELMFDALRLAALTSACGLVETTLPEREPYPRMYDGLLSLFQSLKKEEWGPAYVEWEVSLLRELGFGLDLKNCAVTGTTESLAFVSPRTGRAVSLAVGESYRPSLLILPGFLSGQTSWGPQDILDGLQLTGYFLTRHVFSSRHIGMPLSRQRLIERYSRLAIKCPLVQN